MEKKYETKTFEVTANDLPSFNKAHIKRDLRPKHVEKIVLGIEKVGKVFGTIVLNKIDGDGTKVIDGNHRFKAIEIYLEKNPNGKVGVTFDTYKNLSADEEKEIFMVRNDSEPQNKMDYVQTQCYDTFIYKALIDKKKSFPFSVSLRQVKKVNHIGFQRLIEPYSVRNNRAFRVLQARELMAFIKQMGEDDFNNLKAFALMYVDLFGQPEPDTIETNASFITAFQRLYWSALSDEYGKITQDEFFKRFKANYPNWQNRIKQTSSMGNSAAAQIMTYQKMLDCLNDKARKNMGIKVKSFLLG